MKILFVNTFMLFLVLPFICKAQTDNPLKFKATIKLTMTKIQQYGYSGEKSIDKKKQPITSKDEALEFLIRVRDKETTGTLKEELSVVIEDISTNSNSDYAVLVLRHPLNLTKFYGDELSDNLNKANQDFAAACEKLKKVESLIKLTDKKFDSKDAKFRFPASAGALAGEPDTAKLTANELKEMNDLSTFRTNLITEKKELERIMEESRKLQKESRAEIVEDTKIETYILNKENEEWQDYVLDKKKILLVFIGGIEDFAKAEIKINNKPSSFTTNLNELYQLTTAMGVTKMAPDQTNCSISDPGLQELPVTFALLSKSKVKPPSDIELGLGKENEKITLPVHEKARFGIKVGFSGAFVSRKNFSVSSDNKLTIKADSLKQEELKSNLMALIEWMPWGRDIDRLEPVWSKNKDVKTFSLERLGFTAGVKISKDPLQTLYGGIAYSLSKEVALNLGIAFYATPKDIKDLPVTADAALDYLKDNADRKLEPKIYFGISFSPGQLGKALGIIK